MDNIEAEQKAWALGQDDDARKFAEMMGTFMSRVSIEANLWCDGGTVNVTRDALDAWSKLSEEDQFATAVLTRAQYLTLKEANERLTTETIVRLLVELSAKLSEYGVDGDMQSPNAAVTALVEAGKLLVATHVGEDGFLRGFQ